MDAGDEGPLSTTVAALDPGDDGVPLLRAALDAVRDGVFFADTSGRIVDANAGACRQLGYTRAELVGRAVAEIAGRTDFDLPAVRAAITRAGHLTRVTEHVRKDGRRIPVELTVTELEHRGRWLMVGVARDLSERHAAQEQLTRSEHRYRSLVENLPGTVAIMVDPDLRLVLVDGPEVEATGFSKQLMEGRRLRDAVPAGFADVVEPNLRRVLAGERFAVELPFGDLTYHYEYVPLRGPDGQVEHGLILGQNVTARVQAQRALAEREQQYRALAEHLPDLVARFDRRARLVFVNPVIEAAVGRPVAEVLGRDLHELGMSEAMATSWQQSIEHVLATQLPAAREDIIASPAGPRRWSARLVPESSAGTVHSVLVLSRDVTDERQAEDERRLLDLRLQQAGKLDALGRLAGGVAHDFNNLLTAIQGFAHLLVRNPTIDATAREDLQDIARAAERGSSLTAQLLAFSRKHVAELAYVDVDVLVGQSLRMLQRILGEDVAISFVPGSRDVARVDAGQLEQVLVNLAVNARDAMPGGGRLQVSTATVDVDGAAMAHVVGARTGRYVHLRVRDSGVGMSHETLAHLFEPFYTTKGVGAGTGLGLSIIYGILHKCDGFVDVSSAIGAGATFDIYLPAYDRALLTEPRPARPATPAPRGSAHLLVVEDDRSVLDIAVRILRGHGYVVHTATQATDALRFADDLGLRLDLVVTDVIMPGMNGPQLVERLRAARPTLEAIFMSGYTDDALAHAGLGHGENQFLQKPFLAAGLLAKVAEVLGRRHRAAPPPLRADEPQQGC